MEVVTNVTDVVNKMKLNLNGLMPTQPYFDKMLREIAEDILASNLLRIYSLGKDVEGVSPIGSYSTKATLVGASSFRKKSSAQKVFGQKQLKQGPAKVKKQKNKKDLEWRTVESGGKNVHLAILKGGYKKIREIDGDRTDRVNLKRTGKMFKDLQQGISPITNGWVIGFPASYNDNLTYAEMVDHFREKYGKKIWGVSKVDEKKMREVIARYLKERLNA